jgi:HEPN domain-containing protein
VGVPRDKDAKRFYRAAGQRLEDAAFLLDAARTTAAVYLAGYCVECMLKALILVQAGKENKEEALDSFRGSGAHNYDRLIAMYERYGGRRPTKKDKVLAEAFVIVASWDTDLRYDPVILAEEEATDFVSAVGQISAWADGRL